MKPITFLLVCFLSVNLCHAQTDYKVIDLPITTCDCNGAIVLSDSAVGPMKSSHFGKELEIRNNAADDLYFFEKEHFTTWFVIKAPFTGELILDIISEDFGDDYNFLVFLSSGRWFCNKLREGNEVPIRSNLAHAERGTGVTGLSLDAMEDYVSVHDREAFSSSIQMITGDFYYIVVDNKRMGNKGYTIHARFLRPEEIEEMNGQYQANAKFQNRF